VLLALFLAAPLAGCGGEGRERKEGRAGGGAEAPPARPKAAREAGLLGAPLPEGARLADWTAEALPGEPAGQRDRFERYEVDAPAGDIADFFAKAMPLAGWQRGGAAAPLSFRKGGLTLGVQVKEGGGAFTLTAPPGRAARA
jgi:hypothetical protein